MTPIATALASVSLLVAAAPATAQMHAGGGGHAGGGIQGAAHLGHFAGRGGAHDGRAGHFGRRSNGLRDYRHAHDGYGFWPYGGFALGYGYPWYAEPYDYRDDEPLAYAPPTPPDHAYSRRHDPKACAEWSWAAAKRQYICTRHAS